MFVKILSALAAIPKIAEYMERAAVSILNALARKKQRDRMNRIIETGIKYRSATNKEEIDEALKEYHRIIRR